MKSMDEVNEQPWAMFRDGLTGACCNKQRPHITVYMRCAAPFHLAIDEDGRCPVWRELQAKDAAGPTETPDAAMLSMMLTLIDIDDIPRYVIDGWSEDERRKVADYVGAAHLRASDNDGIEIPPVPEVLKKYRGRA